MMAQSPPSLADAIHEYHRLQNLRSAARIAAAYGPDAAWVRDVVHLFTRCARAGEQAALAARRIYDVGEGHGDIDESISSAALAAREAADGAAEAVDLLRRLALEHPRNRMGPVTTERVRQIDRAIAETMEAHQ